MTAPQSVKTARNSLLIILAKGINTVFVLIYLPFLARYLGKENFGYYTFTYSFVALFQVITWLGVHEIVIREVARDYDQAQRYYNNALSVKIFLSLAAAVCLIVAVYLQNDLNRLTVLLIFIAGAEVIIRSYGIINEAILRAFEKMQIEPLLNLIDQGVAVIGIFVAIIFDLGLVGVMVAFLAGALAHTVAGFWWGSRVVGKIALGSDLSTWKFLVKEGLPIGGSIGIRNIYDRFGTVYLRSWQEIGQVGIYGGGLRIYNLATMLARAMVGSLFPLLSRRALGSRKALMVTAGTNLKVLILAAGAIALALFLLAKTVVLILLGAEFIEVSFVVQILCPGIVFAFAGILFGNLLEATNQQRLTTITWITVLALNVGLNVMLTPSMGYFGTALAFLTTEVLFSLITFYLVWQKVGRMDIRETIIIPMLVIFFCSSLGWILWRQWGSAGALPITMLLYGLLIWKLPIFTSEEKGLLHRTLTGLLAGKG